MNYFCNYMNFLAIRRNYERVTYKSVRVPSLYVCICLVYTRSKTATLRAHATAAAKGKTLVRVRWKLSFTRA